MLPEGWLPVYQFKNETRMESNMSDPTSRPAPTAPPTLPPGRPAPGGKSSHWGLWIVISILLVAAVVFVLLGISHRLHQKQTASQNDSASAPPAAGGRGAGGGPIMVSTTTAQTGNIGVYVNALGVVTPLNTVSVNSRVGGQIMKIYYQEGQLVHAGDPLLDIDSGPNEAALMEAQGQLARDNALLDDAKLDLQRYQEAFASNAIPKQQYDTQVALVHQDEGTVQLDQGTLTNAQVQLAYCHICAPLSGRVGLRLVDAGNIVQANSTNLVVITELQPISVIFHVAEDDLPQIIAQLRTGKTLAVDAFDRALTTKLASGTLTTLDNQIDPTTGMLGLRAVFTNDDESLFPNQFVNARLLVNTLEGVTLLPNTAIQRNADGAFVYLIKPDQTVGMQTITVGTTDGNVSQVDGIDAGTVVAADNFNKLADGAKVTVRQGGAGAGGTHKGGHHHRDSSQTNSPSKDSSEKDSAP